MVKFTATVQNTEHEHAVTVKTNDKAQSINIAPKAGGFGSSMNGGEAFAEIHNTLRQGTSVTLGAMTGVSSA